MLVACAARGLVASASLAEWDSDADYLPVSSVKM
jgi:hypothetical protein